MTIQKNIIGYLTNMSIYLSFDEEYNALYPFIRPGKIVYFTVVESNIDLHKNEIEYGINCVGIVSKLTCKNNETRTHDIVTVKNVSNIRISSERCEVSLIPLHRCYELPISDVYCIHEVSEAFVKTARIVSSLMIMLPESPQSECNELQVTTSDNIPQNNYCQIIQFVLLLVNVYIFYLLLESVKVSLPLKALYFT